MSDVREPTRVVAAESICGSCGMPVRPGEGVEAEPLLEMRSLGSRDVVVTGARQCFHAGHLPRSVRWRIVTAADPVADTA